MKNAILIFLSFYLVCCNQVDEIKPMSYDEITKINSVNDLDIQQYLNLVSSIDVITKITISRDSTVRLFAPLTSIGIYKNLVPISGELTLVKDMTKSDIDYLLEMGESKKPAITSFKTIASYASDSLSTIGAQSLFLISMYKGDKYFHSNGELTKYQSEINSSYNSWWDKQN